MKLPALLTSLLLASAASAHSAVISGATFDLDPSSVAADSDQNERVDQPLSFTSITVGGTVYSDFTYGVASNANSTYFYTPGENPGNSNLALGGSLVTDGVLNVASGTTVSFGRAITAADWIFFTDLEPSTDTTRDDDITVQLIDINGTIIADTLVTFVDPFEGAAQLFRVDADRPSDGILTNSSMWGAAFQLSDFMGYAGSGAYGIRFSGSQTVDPSIIGLAAIPEPTSAALLGLSLGGAMLLRRRRRKHASAAL